MRRVPRSSTTPAVKYAHARTRSCGLSSLTLDHLQYRWFDFKEVPPVGKLLQSVPVLTGIALWLVLCLIFITAFYKVPWLSPTK
jgi:hypothetical protein